MFWTDKLPLAVVTRTINILAERVNHGFRDTPASEKGDIINIDDSDESGAESSTSKVAKGRETEGDLPRGYDTVPNGLRLFRWEVKKELRSDLFACLSKEMQEKIESRAEERLQVSTL